MKGVSFIISTIQFGLPFPAYVRLFPLLGVGDVHIGGMEDGIVAGFFLAGIVIEDAEGLAAHAQDDDDIDQGLSLIHISTITVTYC